MGIVQLNCISLFTRDALQAAFMASLPLLIIVIAPRRRPFLRDDYSEASRLCGVTARGIPSRDHRHPKSFFARTNAIMRSETSLRHISLGGWRWSRKEYIRHARLRHIAQRLRDHRRRIGSTYLDRPSPGIDRSRRHTPGFAASLSTGRSIT